MSVGAQGGPQVSILPPSHSKCGGKWTERFPRPRWAPGRMGLASALPSSLFRESPLSSSSGSAEMAHSQVQAYRVPYDTNLKISALGPVLDTRHSLKSTPTRSVF